LILAGALVVALIPIHFILNARNDPEGTSNYGQSQVILTKDNYERVSGTFSWRFFKWGILYGDSGTVTEFYRMLRTLGMSHTEAQQFDIGNPTPFTIFGWLLILAAISFFRFEGTDKKESPPPTVPWV
jgi:hypothetical protein